VSQRIERRSLLPLTVVGPFDFVEFLQAEDGMVDLSKVQVESVIVWVVKQKFPPPSAQAGKN
jgi:hypothetical protein